MKHMPNTGHTACNLCPDHRNISGFSCSNSGGFYLTLMHRLIRKWILRWKWLLMTLRQSHPQPRIHSVLQLI